MRCPVCKIQVSQFRFTALLAFTLPFFAGLVPDNGAGAAAAAAAAASAAGAGS